MPRPGNKVRMKGPPAHQACSLWRRHMRVKLCARCPYSPHDLAYHYDPEAALYACAKCDNEPALGEPRWRQKSSTKIETSNSGKSNVAPCVKGNLAPLPPFSSPPPPPLPP